MTVQTSTAGIPEGQGVCANIRSRLSDDDRSASVQWEELGSCCPSLHTVCGRVVLRSKDIPVLVQCVQNMGLNVDSALLLKCPVNNMQVQQHIFFFYLKTFSWAFISSHVHHFIKLSQADFSFQMFSQRKMAFFKLAALA